MSAAQLTEPYAGAEPDGATLRTAGYCEPGQSRPDQSGPGQSRPGQSRPDQGGPDWGGPDWGGPDWGGPETGGHGPEPEEPLPVLLSVVVPVLHEAPRIAALVGHVRALAGELPPGTVELVVADGAPEGDTLAALKTALGRDAWRAATGLVAADLAPTSHLVTALAAEDFSGTGMPVRAVAAPRGRARQMNAGAAVARGQVLLFLHADTRLPDGAFPAVLRALGVGRTGGAGGGEARYADDAASCAADGVPGAGAFTLSIDAPGAWFRVVETLGNLRNRLTRTPYGDQAQFFRAGVFRALGGYPDLPLMEDVEIMRRLRRQHRRHCRHRADQPLALLDLRAVTSARRWRDEGAVRCTLRNVCLRLLYALGVPAQILARWYRARKGAS